MKKFCLILTLVILSIAFSIAFTSCKNAVSLDLYLSEIRSAVYYGKFDNYSLSVYVEEKETPYLSDGFVGEMKKYVTVRVEDYRLALNDATVTVIFGNTECFGKFNYSPLDGKFITEIETNKLPIANEITIKLKSNGEEEVFTLEKLSVSGAINYQTALDKVSYYKEKEIKKMLSSKGATIETRVRILNEDKSVYYFVSVTDQKGETIAFLVDGATGEILAEKTF